jgi:hypothetical protein
MMVCVYIYRERESTQKDTTVGQLENMGAASSKHPFSTRETACDGLDRIHHASVGMIHLQGINELTSGIIQVIHIPRGLSFFPQMRFNTGKTII